MAIFNTVYGGEKWKPNANTIAYYPLTSSTTINDQSGNGNNLTNNWITFWTYSWVNCWYFNGNYAYKSWSLFTWNPTFACSIWAKMTNYWVYWAFWQTTSNYSFIVFRDDPSWKIKIWWWSNDQLTPYVVDANWHNIIFTYGSWNWSVYVDGVDVYDGTRSPNIQNDKTVIWANTAFSTPMQWYMSEVIFENKKWSLSEAENYYNKTKANYWL